MSNSLFDQLKKTGLIDEKKAQQAKREKHRQVKKKKGKKAGPPAASKLQAQQAQAEKVARDRELNRQREQAAKQKAIAAQVKQIILANRIENNDGRIRFNFIDDNKVQQIYVTEKLQDQLALGSLAIVKLEGSYVLVSADAAKKIKDRAPSLVMHCKVAQGASGDSGDPYAEYQVPDDLMW